MSLKKYLEENKIDQIEDDQEFMEKEYDAIHTYCKNCRFLITKEDLDTIKLRGLEEFYTDWKQSYIENLEDKNSMITRKDIVNALLNLGYEVEKHTSIKNGVEFDGLRFINKNNMCPVIYTDDIIEESQSLSEAVEKILQIYYNIDMPDFDQENLINPAFVLKNLYIGLQKESEEQIVKKETEFEGIEQYLYVRISNDMSYKFTNILYENLKLNEDEMWSVAENNTFSRTKIVSISEMIFGETIEDELLYVVTNDINFRGASAILDQENLKEFAKKLDIHKFIVLPSSIHEVIITPYNTSDISYYDTMVTEINQTQVNPEERLTDRAYVIEV